MEIKISSGIQSTSLNRFSLFFFFFFLILFYFFCLISDSGKIFSLDSH